MRFWQRGARAGACGFGSAGRAGRRRPAFRSFTGDVVAKACRSGPARRRTGSGPRRGPTRAPRRTTRRRTPRGPRRLRPSRRPRARAPASSPPAPARRRAGRPRAPGACADDPLGRGPRGLEEILFADETFPGLAFAGGKKMHLDVWVPHRRGAGRWPRARRTKRRPARTRPARRTRTAPAAARRRRISYRRTCPRRARPAAATRRPAARAAPRRLRGNKTSRRRFSSTSRRHFLANFEGERSVTAQLHAVLLHAESRRRPERRDAARVPAFRRSRLSFAVASPAFERGNARVPALRGIIHVAAAAPPRFIKKAASGVWNGSPPSGTRATPAVSGVWNEGAFWNEGDARIRTPHAPPRRETTLSRDAGGAYV